MEGIKIGDMMLYDVEGLAKALGIQERTIRRYLREGKLQGKKMARKWYVTADSVKAYFQQPAQTGSGPVEERQDDNRNR